MKLGKKVVISGVVSLSMILLIAVQVYGRINRNNETTTSDNVLKSIDSEANITSNEYNSEDTLKEVISYIPLSERTHTLMLESLTPTEQSESNTKTIMKKIDGWVDEININMINNQHGDDYYNGDILQYRNFVYKFNYDDYVSYDMYFNEQGKLTYVEVTHYRGTCYNLYFKDDKLFHVEVGSFEEGDLSLKGNMVDVTAIIENDPHYTFVIEDVALCLEHAYK